jgi:DNA-binding CsgD family transcriptional regulator
MIVVSPICPDEHLNLPTRNLCEVVTAIGTDAYGGACLRLLTRVLNAEHWVLFRFRPETPPKCLATASGHDQVAAKENIDRFVIRCHNADPSIKAAAQRNGASILTKLATDDIKDRQYRRCFELTQVHERLSLVSWVGGDLYQLSVFRCRNKTAFSAHEMNRFAALAKVLLTTAQRHEMALQQQHEVARHLTIGAIGRLLKLRSPTLSPRECEVCALALAGKTIDATSLDLKIRRTSVVTYRHRAYRKFGISRMNELMALLSELHAEGALAS